MAEKGAEYKKWEGEEFPSGLDVYNADRYIAEFDNKEDGQLALAAVNACISINKECPQAVAEGMEEAVEKLRKVSKWQDALISQAEAQLSTCRFVTLKDAITADLKNYKATKSDIEQALSKITGGK